VSHRLTESWVDPDSYRPERWLGDEKYAADRKDAYKPFSFGPRDCVGKKLVPRPFPISDPNAAAGIDKPRNCSLSYAEMRLILARIVWNFDMNLDRRSENWIEQQECYVLWRKPPLYVNLTPVIRK
jgi:hypothetical protein